MIEGKHWEAAYKKLKASVFYDKTQALLRDKIVLFEKEYEFDSKKICDHFSNLNEILFSKSSEPWEKYSKGIINQVCARYFPKEMFHNQEKNVNDLADVIINMRTSGAVVSKTQSFIDIPLEGQVLGILWIMTIGATVAKEEYRHSYGNKLCKRLVDDSEKNPFSPYLFEPYFAQYENWRDHGIEIARSFLDKGENIIILMIDFQRFYYSVHITQNDMESCLKHYLDAHPDIGADEKLAIKRINNFVYGVLKRYSELFKNVDRVFLPIGFYPSGVLANAFMKKFDATLDEQWNPLYYGRYVDDIIIVDKVGKGSFLEEKANKNELSSKDILEYFMLGCSVERTTRKNREETNSGMGLLVNQKEGYQLNPLWLKSDVDQNEPNEKYKILLSKGKTRAFFFRPEGSQVLLKEFQRILRTNSSEFRYLPWDDDEAIDYSSIIQVKNSATPNKLSGVDSVEINKYGLSKFIGKLTMYQQFAVPKSEEFNRDNELFKDLMQWLDQYNIVCHYLLWGRIIQLLLMREQFDDFKRILDKIDKAISSIEYKNDDATKDIEAYDETSQEEIADNIRESLCLYLMSVLGRELSLHWGAKVKDMLVVLQQSSIAASIPDVYAYLLSMRKGYCYSRLCDKYRMPVLIDFMLPIKHGNEALNDNLSCNLTSLQDCLNLMKESAFNLMEELDFNKNYIFSPYIVTHQEMSVCYFWQRMLRVCEDTTYNDINDVYKYCQYVNYKIDMPLKHNKEGFIRQLSLCNLHTKDKNVFAYEVSSVPLKKMRIAVANLHKDYKEFNEALQGKIYVAGNQYNNIATVLNEAKKNHTNLLVLPESIMPVEWLMPIGRWCARNQIGLVAGIAHFPYENYIINMTATILPYKKDNRYFSYMIPHLKVLYSPEERQDIESVNKKVLRGNSYEIFGLNNVWFSVYCCYELTSIRDRSIFQNIVDLFIAVEWNKDVKYFSSILESLCRDMHCYCAQSNVSQFGDSRVIRPSSSVNKDMIRIKGGINPSLQIVDLDIESLRNFQCLGYMAQKKAANRAQFKPTPPYFERELIRAKQDNKMWEYLSQYSKNRGC